MTLADFFYGLGDIFQWTFNFLQNDFWLTTFMTYALPTLGFIGLFFWLNKQRKFNIEAEHNPDQRK